MKTKTISEHRTMSEDVKWLYGIVSIPVIWFIKLMWSNHTSLQELRREIAGEYPTWSELKREIQGCSDQKDHMIKEQNERVEKSLNYIITQVDNIRDREIKK